MVARAPRIRRPSKQAKIIPIPDQRSFVNYVANLRHGQRNQVIALLSFKAGLRAAEIAGVEWSMICDAGGRVSDCLEISRSIAKMGAGRRIPFNRELRTALIKLHIQQGRPRHGPVCRSERGGPMTPKGIVNWFREQYRVLGYHGASSHSGRRTMITLAARALAQVGGSLRDVQELAGHRSLATTEKYIQGDRDVQRKLVEIL